MTIHNRLSLFRTEAGLSRKDVAETVGVNPQTIGYLERGDYSPSVELSLKLAALFGVPVEALFSLTPFPSLSQTIRTQSALAEASPTQPAPALSAPREAALNGGT